MNCSSNNDLKLAEIKNMSRKIGITINDLVTSAISMSLKRLLDENGDTNESVQIVIPANVRFEFYPTREDVKLENKFASIPLRLPLYSNMKEAYTSVQKLMKKFVRDNYLVVYASYASTFYGNMIFPRTISRRLVDSVSPKFLLAFSNNPGPIKPLYYENE